jgi:hypothetical protein
MRRWENIGRRHLHSGSLECEGSQDDSKVEAEILVLGGRAGKLTAVPLMSFETNPVLMIG